MSIYFYRKEIQKLTNNIFKPPLCPQIIAWDKNNIPLLTTNIPSVRQIPGFDKPEEDFEKELLILSEKKDIYIDHHFWNYKYNQKNQLSPLFLKDLENQIKVLIDDVSSCAYGLFLTRIIFHEIIVNMYYLNSDKFSNMLDNINIDKTVIKNILLSYNYNLPFNNNYLLLMKRLFNDQKILELIFPRNNKESFFSCQEINEILEEIPLEDINGAYNYITSNPKYSLETKLIYIKCLLENNKNLIDQEDTIYYSVNNPKLSLGFYLYNLNIEGPLTNIYYQIMDLFINMNGIKKIIVIDDDDLNKKIASKLLT